MSADILKRTEAQEDLKQEVFVGLGVIIQNGYGEILLGRRSNKSGYGLLAVPGGLVDKTDGGKLRMVGIRETLEEVGLDLSKNEITVVSVDESFISKNRFMNYGLHTKVEGRPELSVPKPDEFSEWAWYPYEEVLKIVDEPGIIFEPSRISLLCFFRGEILYPFNEEVPR